MHRLGVIVGRVLAAAAMIALSSGVVRAQAPAPKPALAAPDEVKATGCVSKDEQGQFTLQNAAIEVQPYYGAGAAAAKGTSKPQASGTTFILKGGTNLAIHAGHKVTVVGKVEPGSATSGGVSIGRSQMVYVPRLAVQSVTALAASCK